MQADVIGRQDVIQRQYDEVIAPRYDFDPHGVVGDSLDRALRQIERHAPAGELRALDLGVGTGRFLEKLRGTAGPRVRPYGLDLSRNMIDLARRRVPDLEAVVDTAVNVDAHFPGVAFDLVCTHFITGFVPLADLAPKIFARLGPGGLYSFVGGTSGGFPALQAKVRWRPVRWMFGIKSVDVRSYASTPADEGEVAATLRRHGFAVREIETFRPDLSFKDWDAFFEFAYYGGWLTSFIEGMGLHKASPLTRAFLNAYFFPLRDRHHVVIALAQKP